jgi:hypothetical protein
VIVLSLRDATPVEALVTVRQAARLYGVGRHVLYRAAELQQHLAEARAGVAVFQVDTA